MTANWFQISLVVLVATSILAFIAALARWPRLAIAGAIAWFVALAAYSVNRWSGGFHVDLVLPVWIVPLLIAFVGVLLAALIFRARFSTAIGIVLMLITLGLFFAYL